MNAKNRTCIGCGAIVAKRRMSTIDVSTNDEYYPAIRYLCPGCSRDDPAIRGP